MGKSFMNVWTYLGIIFIFSIAIAIILNFASFLGQQHINGVIDLPVSQQEYILKLQNVNISNLNATDAEIEDPISYTYNSSSGTPKDFSIEFLFAQEKSLTIREKIQYVYSMPSIILYMLGLPVTEFQFLVNAILWLIATGIFIAIIFLIRAVVT